MALERTESAGSQSVVALHCSGAGAGQWRELGEALGSRYRLLAPEHYGCPSVGPWTGAHAFTLADEAERTLALIDAAPSKVHLVGHSYGGGLALHIALARPHRIASLAVYEPSAFHLLRQIDGGIEPLAEILAMARATCAGVLSGNYQEAAAAFVDYWNGKGAWNELRPDVQAALIKWVPKAPLDFAALVYERSDVAAYADLGFPALVIRGEHAPGPTRLIAETLPALMPDARLAVVPGAGHMGPLTHAAAVNALIAGHVAAAVGGARQTRIDRPLAA